MKKGTVIWFSRHKGYGFIHVPEWPDIYFHWTDLKMEGYRKIKAGKEVLFRPVWTRLGPAAKDVSRVKREH